MVDLLENAVTAAISANHNGERPQSGLRTRVDVRKRYWSRWKMSRQRPGNTARAADADFRAILFYPKGGTGLGLAIVSAIVADHHGFVRVRDNPPRGSDSSSSFR